MTPLEQEVLGKLYRIEKKLDDLYAWLGKQPTDDDLQMEVERFLEESLLPKWVDE
jgi:hypothetical protein